jgi:hypothetical protein
MNTVVGTSTESLSLHDRVQAAVARQPRLMTSQLARELQVPEAEILRALPKEQVIELRADAWEDIIRALEPVGDLHVIVNSDAVTLECFGTFGNFSTWQQYFNVQTQSIDMDIRYEELSSIFAVIKPSHMDGRSTLSIQFFDRQGTSAFKVFFTFGGKEPPQEKIDAFDAIIERFRTKGSNDA